MGAPITHVEINSNQQKKLLDFYAKLFDWHMDTSNPMGYAMVDTHAGKGIGAGIGQAQNGSHNFVTFYVDVTDLKGTLDKAEKLGAKTVLPPTKTGPVEIAMFADPEGNVIGLAKGM
jgi:predicted enzyme related to lactoylglutathione lyase